MSNVLEIDFMIKISDKKLWGFEFFEVIFNCEWEI